MRISFYKVLGLGGVLALLLCVLFQMEGSLSNWWDKEWRDNNRKTEFNQQEIIERIRTLAELATVEETIQTIVTAREKNALWGIKLGGADLLYVAFGSVKAGINLAQLEPGAVAVRDERIIIRLPQPVLLSVALDLERSYVYDLRYSLIFPPSGIMLQSQAEQTALQRIRQAALQSGIIEKAREQTVIVITALLKTAGYTNEAIEIEWLPPDPELESVISAGAAPD